MSPATATLFQNIAARVPSRALFELCPKFTSGSPAVVSRAECVRGAEAELSARDNALAGVWGEELRAAAERPDALKHVAFARWEARGKVWRFDLITGETLEEPPRLTTSEREDLTELRSRDPIAINPAHARRRLQLEERLAIHRETLRE